MEKVTIETADFRIVVEDNERAICYRKDNKFILAFFIESPEVCAVSTDFCEEEKQIAYIESFYAISELSKWREYIH